MSVPSSAVAWVRLDPKALLLHPLKELLRYLPGVVLALLAGAAVGEPWWAGVLLCLGTAVALLRWSTTAYQITGSSLLIRRGVLNRQHLTIPLTRIRSVEIEQTVLHRLFRLAVLRIRTAAARGEEDLELSGIRVALASSLRKQLLVHAGRTSPAPQSAVPATTLVRWRKRWTVYAPFTMVGATAVVGAAAFLAHLQALDDGVVRSLPPVQVIARWLEVLPVPAATVTVVTVLAILGAVISMAAYLFAYSSFQVTRPAPAELLIQRGAIQQRQTLLNLHRLRGVELTQPLPLRLVGAASLRVIMTGLAQTRTGATTLCPTSPWQHLLQAAAQVVDPTTLTVPLVQHGKAARSRRYTRIAVVLAGLALTAALAQAVGLVPPTIWVLAAPITPAGWLLAADRYRGLGHLVLNDQLILSSGSLLRRRVVLELEGITGWTIKSSPLQRRAGLTTLIATSAAGRRRYALPDIPTAKAWDLIARTSRHLDQPGGRS